MISYSKPKLSDLFYIRQSKLLEKHTLHSGTYLYSLYMAVTPVYFAYQHSTECSRSCGQQLRKFIGTKKPVQASSTPIELVWARRVLLGFLGGGCAARFFKS